MHQNSLWPFYDERTLDAATKVLSASDLGAVRHHPSVAAFEKAFIECLELPVGNAAFYNSGTSALAAAFFAADIQSGAEVLVPISTFRSTVTPLFQFGIVPVFVPCSRDTMSLDPLALDGLITPKTRAIVVNHQWGIPVDISAIQTVARTHGLFIIEDASHAHTTKVNGIPAGACGDIAVFSCGTTKMVSGGLGGILYTANTTLFERAILFGLAKHRVLATAVDPVIRRKADVGLGVNLRGHPVAAELALGNLRQLQTIAKTKQRNIDNLNSLVSELVPSLTAFEKPARWTEGTWYKLPFRTTSPEHARLLVQKGKARGLRLERSHRNLNVQFGNAFAAPEAETQSLPKVAWRNGPPAVDFDDVVLFDTRDLYIKDVDFAAYREKLKQLEVVD